MDLSRLYASYVFAMAGYQPFYQTFRTMLRMDFRGAFNFSHGQMSSHAARYGWRGGYVHYPPLPTYFVGSTEIGYPAASNPVAMVKCRCGPVELPLFPTDAICCPFDTISPGCTVSW